MVADARSSSLFRRQPVQPKVAANLARRGSRRGEKVIAQGGPFRRPDDLAFVQIERPRDLDLHSVRALAGRAVMLSDEPARKRLVAANPVSRRTQARFENLNHARRRARAVTIAEDDVQPADVGGRAGHGMAIEQNRCPASTACALDHRFQSLAVWTTEPL